MDPHPEVVIPNINEDQVNLVRQWFSREGGSAPSGNSGFAENQCFAAKFDYYANESTLILEPHRLVRGLTPTRIRKLVQCIIRPPQLLAADSGHPQPTPYSCATYNYAIGFIQNNSDGVLTFSGVNTVNGNLSSPAVSKVALGAKFTDANQANGCWINSETKDATNGCTGTISYQLADGMTEFTINYNVNTAMPYTASAPLNGQNGSRWNTTCTFVKSFNGGTASTYLYVYVSIDPA